MPHLRPGAARELPAGRYVLCEHAPVLFVSSCPPAPRRKMRPAATKAGPWLGCLGVLARGSQSRCPHTNAYDSDLFFSFPPARLHPGGKCGPPPRRQALGWVVSACSPAVRSRDARIRTLMIAAG